MLSSRLVAEIRYVPKFAFPETISVGYFCKTRFDKKIVDFMPRLVPVTRIIWQQTKVCILFKVYILIKVITFTNIHLNK